MEISIDYKGTSYQNYDYDELVNLLDKGIVDAEIEKKQAEEIRDLRKQAYILEADPLYLEWQYDKTPEKELLWRDKVAEIKVRYPL